MAEKPDPPSTGKRSVQVAAGLIWRADGHVLISRRPEGGRHAGDWELPGGKLETGESPPEALVREIREELAITVEAGPEFHRVAHDYGDLVVLLIGLHARYSAGSPRCLGVSEWRWISPADLPEYTFPAANTRLFESDWRTPPPEWGIAPAGNREQG